jgi:hypothetical protein
LEEAEQPGMTEGEASAIARVRTDDLIDDKRTFLTYAAPKVITGNTARIAVKIHFIL